MTDQTTEPDSDYVQVTPRTEARKGVQCGQCRRKFEYNVAYTWNCVDPLCPFDYGPYYQGTVSAPRGDRER